MPASDDEAIDESIDNGKSDKLAKQWNDLAMKILSLKFIMKVQWNGFTREW